MNPLWAIVFILTLYGYSVAFLYWGSCRRLRCSQEKQDEWISRLTRRNVSLEYLESIKRSFPGYFPSYQLYVLRYSVMLRSVGAYLNYPKDYQ